MFGSSLETASFNLAMTSFSDIVDIRTSCLRSAPCGSCDREPRRPLVARSASVRRRALLVLWRGVRITRRATVSAGVLLAAAGAFYMSPAGTKLRARVHWSLQEPAGGARLWLWRDSLRMAALRGPVRSALQALEARLARPVEIAVAPEHDRGFDIVAR